MSSFVKLSSIGGPISRLTPIETSTGSADAETRCEPGKGFDHVRPQRWRLQPLELLGQPRAGQFWIDVVVLEYCSEKDCRVWCERAVPNGKN